LRVKEDNVTEPTEPDTTNEPLDRPETDPASGADTTESPAFDEPESPTEVAGPDDPDL
jgi:hypothetical protein